MTDFKKPYVIAEIGCNHKGDIAIAKELSRFVNYYLLRNLRISMITIFKL